MSQFDGHEPGRGMGDANGVLRETGTTGAVMLSR